MKYRLLSISIFLVTSGLAFTGLILPAQTAAAAGTANNSRAPGEISTRFDSQAACTFWLNCTSDALKSQFADSGSTLFQVSCDKSNRGTLKVMKASLTVDEFNKLQTVYEGFSNYCTNWSPNQAIPQRENWCRISSQLFKEVFDNEKGILQSIGDLPAAPPGADDKSQ